MNYILFDGTSRKDLLPLTFTRPIADIRIGILTLREKWEKRLDIKSSILTVDYLSGKYPTNSASDNMLLYGGLCPNEHLIEVIASLKLRQGLIYKDKIIGSEEYKERFYQSDTDRLIIKMKKSS